MRVRSQIPRTRMLSIQGIAKGVVLGITPLEMAYVELTTLLHQ